MLSRRLLLSALAALPVAAHAADNVRLIVPFPAGGGGDTLARSLAPELSSQLGKSVYIDNRPGAGGTLGTNLGSKAAADGKTLTYFTNGTLCVNPVLYPDIAGKPSEALRPLGGLSEIPLILVVNAKAMPEVRTMKDFVAYLKKNPETPFANSGVGTTSHLAGIVLSQTLGLPLLPVPFRGGAQAMLSLLEGKQTPFMIEVAANALPHVKSGALRAIAVTSSVRMPALPEVQTMKEAGYPALSLTAWDGAAVPQSTPEAEFKALAAAYHRAASSAVVEKKIRTLGAMPAPRNSGEFAKFLEKELPRWQSAASRIARQPPAK